VSVEAPVLPCRGCGAPLAVDPVAAEARCARCHAVTPVPEPLRQRAREYQRSLGAERGRVVAARGSGPDAFAKIGKYFGPPLAVLIAGQVVGQMVAGEEYSSIVTGAFVGGMVILGIAFAVWLGFAMRKEMRDDDPAAAPAPGATPAPPPPPMFQGSVQGTCSTCGGQVTFVIEQPSTRCPFCGATVYAPAATQQALLGMAAQGADLEVGRASRVHARELAATFEGGLVEGVFSWMRWLKFVLPPVLFLFIGGTLVFQNGMPDLGAPDLVTTMGLVLMGAGVFVGACIALIVWLVSRFSRANAVRRAVDAIAAAVQGQVQRGVKPVFDWLDASWAAAVPQEVLSVANSDEGQPIVRSSVAFTFAGRPALLVVAHAPHVKRTDLFFAQHKRRTPDQGQNTMPAHEVRGAGYALLVSTGGVHMCRLDSDPRGFAPPTVQWLLERGAQVAQA
jgi:LSD1 subclass zinc finger protein